MILRLALRVALAVAVAATSGIAAAQAQVEIGRYQVVLINDKAGHLAVLVDTVTGRSWILNASNDRFWNLQLYYADATAVVDVDSVITCLHQATQRPFVDVVAPVRRFVGQRLHQGQP